MIKIQNSHFREPTIVSDSNIITTHDQYTCRLPVPTYSTAIKQIISDHNIFHGIFDLILVHGQDAMITNVKENIVLNKKFAGIFQKNSNGSQM